MCLKWLIQRYREQEEQHHERLLRLRRAYEASERLRIELLQLEHEIYELWASERPRRQKALLEEAIRVRCRQVEREMAALQAEIWHSGQAF
jgi:hypothetical protein